MGPIVREATRYEVVPVPVDAVIYAINARGEGAGHRVTEDGSMRAIRIAGDAVIELGTLGGSASCARGINEEGVVVGGSLTADDDAHHAFVYDAGTMEDLNSRIPPESGWELVQALSINDRGEITAIGHRDGQDQVVILRPHITVVD